jgi:hypothetical protein
MSYEQCFVGVQVATLQQAAEGREESMQQELKAAKVMA